MGNQRKESSPISVLRELRIYASKDVNLPIERALGGLLPTGRCATSERVGRKIEVKRKMSREQRKVELIRIEFSRGKHRRLNQKDEKRAVGHGSNK